MAFIENWKAQAQVLGSELIWLYLYINFMNSIQIMIPLLCIYHHSPWVWLLMQTYELAHSIYYVKNLCHAIGYQDLYLFKFREHSDFAKLVLKSQFAASQNHTQFCPTVIHIYCTQTNDDDFHCLKGQDLLDSIDCAKQASIHRCSRVGWCVHLRKHAPCPSFSSFHKWGLTTLGIYLCLYV